MQLAKICCLLQVVDESMTNFFIVVKIDKNTCLISSKTLGRVGIFTVTIITEGQKVFTNTVQLGGKIDSSSLSSALILKSFG